MMKSDKVQTGLRLSPAMIARLKVNARKRHMTFNGYVEAELNKLLGSEFPKLSREDFIPGENILALGKTIRPFTAEELEADSKLAYLLSES